MPHSLRLSSPGPPFYVSLPCSNYYNYYLLVMNRQYSQKIFNGSNTPFNYQNEMIVHSPRHQQVSSPEYYKGGYNNPPPRGPTPTNKGMVSPPRNPPFMSNGEPRNNSRSKSPKRKVVVSPSPKPDLKSSRQRKIVEVQVRRKEDKPSKNSLFQTKPTNGPIMQIPNTNSNKIESHPYSKLQQTPTTSSLPPKIYCSEQEVVNLIQGKLSKQLDRMSIHKQMLDSNIKQIKQGVGFYYDKLEERIRSYRRLDYDKIKEYQKSCIRHIHDYESIFNKAMGDIISIKSDYTKDKTITHEYTIATLQKLLKSYQNEKVKKLHYVYKDLTALIPYDSASTLSYTDPSPPIASQPLIKFDTRLDVKQVVSDNYIVNNPEFSFFDPEHSGSAG